MRQRGEEASIEEFLRTSQPYRFCDCIPRFQAQKYAKYLGQTADPSTFSVTAENLNVSSSIVVNDKEKSEDVCREVQSVVTSASAHLQAQSLRPCFGPRVPDRASGAIFPASASGRPGRSGPRIRGGDRSTSAENKGRSQPSAQEEKQIATAEQCPTAAPAPFPPLPADLMADLDAEELAEAEAAAAAAAAAREAAATALRAAEEGVALSRRRLAERRRASASALAAAAEKAETDAEVAQQEATRLRIEAQKASDEAAALARKAALARAAAIAADQAARDSEAAASTPSFAAAGASPLCTPSPTALFVSAQAVSFGSVVPSAFALSPVPAGAQSTSTPVVPGPTGPASSAPSPAVDFQFSSADSGAISGRAASQKTITVS